VGTSPLGSPIQCTKMKKNKKTKNRICQEETLSGQESAEPGIGPEEKTESKLGYICEKGKF